MVDDMLDYLANVRERPAWQPVPKEIKKHLSAPAPEQPQGAAGAYEDFLLASGVG
jgi:hypothetical protein